MKKNWTLRFLGLAAVLTLVTFTLVAGTFAKYTTKVDARANVTVAKWVANFEDKGTGNGTYTTTFNLLGTLNDSGVDEGLLAPGTKGSFALKYNTSGTQVAHNVKIELATGTDVTYLKFYSDATRKTEIESDDSGNLELLNQNFSASAAGTAGTEDTVNVYWAWPFESDNAAQDTADTAAGIAAKSYDVTVTFTATQLDN